MRNIIDKFRDKYEILSNFYIGSVTYDGVTFSNAESAFQAAKIKCDNRSDTLKLRSAFINISPSEAKKMGRRCKLREDWEQIKDTVMIEILRDKFNRGTVLGDLLLETGDAILIEGNSWHDNYWGKCNCSRCANKTGLNKLGITLMQIREELRGGK